ncbi:MAG TPA: dCTP deaminase [Thermoanaerobaculia bacterium]|nr:dCTP deaminase [Thermoanaerobaculia bacterium]
MVLSKPDILRYLSEGRLRIDPPLSQERVAQVSVDLSLGRKFTSFRAMPGYLPAIHVDPSLWTSTDLWHHCEQDVFRLNPGEFVLAQTLERVSIPSDLVGFVEGRSSWARIGVTIHVTAPKIDPGFNAPITLEMANFGRVPVDLRAGVDKPAQLILMRISTPLDELELYGAGRRDSFQYQTDPIPYRQGLDITPA